MAKQETDNLVADLPDWADYIKELQNWLVNLPNALTYPSPQNKGLYNKLFIRPYFSGGVPRGRVSWPVMTAATRKQPIYAKHKALYCCEGVFPSTNKLTWLLVTVQCLTMHFSCHLTLDLVCSMLGKHEKKYPKWWFHGDEYHGKK